MIDVFRAFTTAAYVLANGALRIIPVGDLEEAFGIKRRNPAFILMGERKGYKVEGFDYVNSPFEIQNVDFSEKTVVMTTSAGTQGIVNATGASQILLGNFVCIKATIDFIKKAKPSIVTLVAVGHQGIEKRDEDEMCAQYIQESLRGAKPDIQKILRYLRSYKSSEKFFDKTKPEFPEGDLHCAMDIDRFNFVLKVVKKENQLEIIRLISPITRAES